MIPAEHPHIYIAAATHPGVKGKLNEDRYSILAYRFSSDNYTPSVLAVLADGIGGHRGGEVAAELAVNDISRYVVENCSIPPVQNLRLAVSHANQAILNYTRQEPTLLGMGTTCVCAWVIGDRLYGASIGDSRLYLQRGAELIRLTTDHTWIQEALAHGTLTPDQVKGHPNAHIIRRFLGSLNAYTPDMRLRLNPAESDNQAEANQGLRLLPGDRLMLCSDGLTDLVEDGEIREILHTRPLNDSPAHFISLANQRGGHDNITVIAMEMPRPADVTRPVPAKVKLKKTPAVKAQSNTAAWLMVLLLLLAIFMLGLLLIFYFVH